MQFSKMKGIFNACYNDDYAFVERYIKNKRDINITDRELKNSPLHYAILSNNVEIVQLLIIFGANLYTKNIFGLSPLVMALKINNEKIKSIIKNRTLKDARKLVV